MLDKIRLLTDEDNDMLIEIYISRAVTSIEKYLNNPKFNDVFIIENFEAAVIAMVENSYNTRDSKYISSKSQGKRSISYNDGANYAINDEVSKLLPTPYVRMM